MPTPSTRIAERDRAIHVERGVEHVAQFVLVLRRHDPHVGDHAHKGDIEDALLGVPILANQPGAVHREDDVQVLHADIVDHLIEGALHKGGVDRRDRAHALTGQAGGECDGVLLGDADIEEAVGKVCWNL